MKSSLLKSLKKLEFEEDDDSSSSNESNNNEDNMKEEEEDDEDKQEYHKLKLPKPPENLRPKIVLPCTNENNEEDVIQVYLPGVMLFCGETYSGKTHLIQYILFQAAHYLSHVVAVCLQGEAKMEYRNLPARAIIWKGFNPGLIQDFMDYQDKKRDPISGICPLAAIVLDDVMGSTDFDNPIMKKFLTQHGHYNVLILIGLQSVTRMFSTTPRQCTSVVAAFSAEQKNMQIMLHENFFNGFIPDIKDYIRENYELAKHVCLWRDKPRKKLFKVIAPKIIPEFQMTFWNEELDKLVDKYHKSEPPVDKQVRKMYKRNKGGVPPIFN